MSAEGYLKQTNVNAQVFPARVVVVNFVALLYSVLAFFAVYLFLKPNAFGPIMLMTIPGLVILFFFALGLANLASVINLGFRDYAPIQSLILQGLFYVTPIIYETKVVDAAGYSFVYLLNPFYYIIDVVRRPMQGLELPPLRNYFMAILITAIVFVVSVIVLMKNKKKLIFKL